MGTRFEDNGDFKYMIVDPEKGGILDLLRFTVWGDEASGVKFLETSPPELARTVASDERWMITVSIVVRKILARVAKPIRWTGSRVEFFLNLLSQNGNLLGLLCNEKVVVPCSESENFLSTVAHLDGRIDLYKTQNPFDTDWSWERAVMGSRALMDLCIMASKLAYENANVVKKVVHENWKMHFVAFYNGWNDFQQRWSTPVFILCDKATDANLILISFRGTELFDPDDWITDFDCVWFEIPGVGKVHAGFVEALGLANRIHPATFADHLQVKKPLSSPNLPRLRIPLAEKSAYYAVGKKLKSLLEEHKEAKFIVTGHSLGGALAILLPTLMLQSEEKEMMQRLLGVYTFGQPRIGNMQLERFMEAHMKHPVPKYIRVVYCNDLVPRLPFDDKLFSYKHFGKCLYYDNLYIRREPVEVPNRNFFGMAYLIPEYVNAWWELIRSLFIGYWYGPHYQEGWFSILLRIGGLILPGVSAHSPRDYVNSVRLGNPYW